MAVLGDPLQHGEIHARKEHTGRKQEERAAKNDLRRSFGCGLDGGSDRRLGGGMFGVLGSSGGSLGGRLDSGSDSRLGGGCLSIRFGGSGSKNLGSGGRASDCSLGSGSSSRGGRGGGSSDGGGNLGGGGSVDVFGSSSRRRGGSGSGGRSSGGVGSGSLGSGGSSCSGSHGGRCSTSSGASGRRDLRGSTVGVRSGCSSSWESHRSGRRSRSSHSRRGARRSGGRYNYRSGRRRGSRHNDRGGYGGGSRHNDRGARRSGGRYNYRSGRRSGSSHSRGCSCRLGWDNYRSGSRSGSNHSSRSGCCSSGSHRRRGRRRASTVAAITENAVKNTGGCTTGRGNVAIEVAETICFIVVSSDTFAVRSTRRTTRGVGRRVDSGITRCTVVGAALNLAADSVDNLDTVAQTSLADNHSVHTRVHDLVTRGCLQIASTGSLIVGSSDTLGVAQAKVPTIIAARDRGGGVTIAITSDATANRVKHAICGDLARSTGIPLVKRSSDNTCQNRGRQKCQGKEGVGHDCNYKLSRGLVLMRVSWV
jgi:hypothetical protein